MSQMPKEFKVPANKDPRLDPLIREIDRFFRYIRADVEKLEQRMTDAEARITALET